MPEGCKHLQYQVWIRSFESNHLYFCLNSVSLAVQLPKSEAKFSRCSVGG